VIGDENPYWRIKVEAPVVVVPDKLMEYLRSIFSDLLLLILGRIARDMNAVCRNSLPICGRFDTSFWEPLPIRLPSGFRRPVLGISCRGVTRCWVGRP